MDAISAARARPSAAPESGLSTSGAPPLDTIHFNATKTCNLGCVFCYDKAVRGRTENLPLDLVAQIAEDAAALGARRVILSGGEPMARRDWREVASTFDAVGMEVSLATNGTLIDDDAAVFLASLRNVTISISIDGGHEIHDRLRDQKGALARTLSGMDALRRVGLSFDVNATVSKMNIVDIPFLTKLARDYGCTMRLSLLHPNGRGVAFERQELEPEEIFELREYCRVLRKTARMNIFVNLPPLLMYLDEVIPGRGAACGWAVNFCGILSNGDVTICGVASDEPDLVAGNVKQRRFREIWSESPLFRFTRSLRTEDLKGICGRCPFNSVCGGACRLSAFREGGDFLAPYSLCQKFYEAGYIPEEILNPVGAVTASAAYPVALSCE
ncbi:MAG: radical SAM protein [Acidobacteriia bacterium]|nr:radical SAM protein [Methyloceanibacter sp.]MBX5472048.1 radical SAM protein [Acetobacteraceae bacterium]MCL6491729.1 radical SAM protein [Terriglobia bacterium]